MAKKQEQITFKIGQQVWLPNTKEVATITAIHKEGLIYVDAGGMNIPVFASEIKAEIPEVKEEKPTKPEVIINTTITDTGVYLLFVPERLHDGEIVHYNCCILNDTNVDVELQFEVYTDDDVFEEGEYMLGKGGRVQLTHFNAEVLNDIKEVELFLVPVKEQYEPFHLRQKISASSFMKKLKYCGPLKQEAYTYEVLKKFANVADKKVVQPTAPVTKPGLSFDADDIKRRMTEKTLAKEYNERMAHNIDVDLHAEAFMPTTHGMTNGEILLAQLEHFNQSFDRALRSGQKIFYAIHGIGSGKLRMEIEKILKNSDYVASYNNSYHPRYGFGATEILLR